MKKTIFTALIAIAACFIIVSFFQPWAGVETSVTAVSKELTDKAGGELKDTPFAGKFIKKLSNITDKIADLGDIEIKTQVTGYNVPRMVNSDTSKVALSLAQIMFKSTEGLTWKSYMVYVLPVSAVLCVFLVIVGMKNKIALIVAFLVSAGLSLVGLYNLHTMDLGTIAIKVTITYGLWNTLYAFLFIAGVTGVWLITDRK